MSDSLRFFPELVEIDFLFVRCGCPNQNSVPSFDFHFVQYLRVRRELCGTGLKFSYYASFDEIAFNFKDSKRHFGKRLSRRLPFAAIELDSSDHGYMFLLFARFLTPNVQNSHLIINNQTTGQSVSRSVHQLAG